ncbi:MAG: GNAT family N-acetyltransferase [Bacteroidetes bacterium]|nr:GNAT family N-acetyltransferase [Bacteroidota bacterium]
MMENFNSLRLFGAKTILRSVDLDDAGRLFSIIENSREHLQRWLPWIDFVHSVEDERHIVEQWIYDMQMKTAIHLCITFEDNVVGFISTHQIDWINQRTSVGYWVAQSSIKMNFATEATAVLLNHLFENLKLHRVFIQAATENAASNRVIKKLGFKWEGILRENERIRDRYLDHNIYGMTHGDFISLKDIFSPYLRK